MDVGGDVDEGLTRAMLTAYGEEMEISMEREKSFLEDLSPDMILSDVDPLPVWAGSHLGIRAFVVGNFTWDWIYRRLFPHIPLFSSRIARAYSGGTYLRLPLGPPHSPCRETREMPLLPGGPPGHPSRARVLTGNRPYTLLAFREKPPGGFPHTGHAFTVASSPVDIPGVDLRITPDQMEKAGVSFSDLLSGAERVVCKAGYGILSLLISENLEATVITGRKFPEEPWLVSGFHRLKGRVNTGENLRREFVTEFKRAAGL